MYKLAIHLKHVVNIIIIISKITLRNFITKIYETKNSLWTFLAKKMKKILQVVCSLTEKSKNDFSETEEGDGFLSK